MTILKSFYWNIALFWMENLKLFGSSKQNKNCSAILLNRTSLLLFLLLVLCISWISNVVLFQKNVLLHIGECERNRQGARSSTPYFDLGPRSVTQAGIYNYLCTINNNFTNRSQKGKIIVKQKNSGNSGGGGRHANTVTSADIKTAAFDE